MSDKYFEALLDNLNVAKVLYVTLCSVVIIVGTPMYYGAAWYEQFGHDKYRTLVNQLISFLCIVMVVHILVCVTGDICIAMFSPLSVWFCEIENYLKNSTLVIIILVIDFILIVKFVLIFYLKTPSIVHADFWNIFLRIWIIAFVFLNQFVHLYFPGKKALKFYICINDFPISDQHSRYKTRWVTIALGFLSLVLCSSIYIKIKLFVKKGASILNHNLINIPTLKKKKYANKKALVSICVAMITILPLFLFFKQMDPLKMNQYPNYYTYWLVHSVSPFYISLFLILYYYDRTTMRKVLYRKTKESIENFYFSQKFIKVNV